MGEVAIILASHGYFAQEALKSVEMIMGSAVENIGVVSITYGKDYETALQEIETLYNQLDKSNGTVVLTDIYGGTPANIATYLTLTQKNTLVFSGFNLPVLLELMYKRTQTLDEIAAGIVKTYEIGLTNISEKLKEREQDGDQMDSY